MTPDRGLDTEIGEPKYARIEFERRWLVDPAMRPEPAGDFTLIEDLYIDGTRLRLRRMTQQASGRMVWKLTKKYHAGRPESRPIVTAYLTQAEFQVFAGLGGNRLIKKRYRFAEGDRTWSLDVFEGPLQGLEIIECETEDVASLIALVPPDWALREVTDMPQWQCGALAAAGSIPEDRWLVS